jgi:hypothetical protein
MSSPCTLRLLSPALSSFGEEREEAGAAFLDDGFNAQICRGILFRTSWRRGRRTAAGFVEDFSKIRFLLPEA